MGSPSHIFGNRRRIDGRDLNGSRGGAISRRPTPLGPDPGVKRLRSPTLEDCLVSPKHSCILQSFPLVSTSSVAVAT